MRNEGKKKMVVFICLGVKVENVSNGAFSSCLKKQNSFVVLLRQLLSS